MEKFVGIKLVEAEPMNALEASKKGYYRGNPASDGELNEMQGYHVHYTDNDYHSWSPKNVFEKSYIKIDNDNVSFEVKITNNKLNFNMDAYILRAIDEHKELTARINKLSTFITSCNADMAKGKSKVDVEDYTLMRIQLEYMINYHDILSARLEKHGIVVSDDKYFEDVTNIEKYVPVGCKSSGSDFDLDKQHEDIQN